MALAAACLTLAAMPSAAYAGRYGSFVHRAGQGYAPGTSAGRLGVINLHRAFSFRGLRQTQNSDVTLADRASTRGSNAIEITKAASI
jgi:hypothetical protein